MIRFRSMNLGVRTLTALRRLFTSRSKIAFVAMALVLLAASAGIVTIGAVQSETLSGLGAQGDRELAQGRVANSKEDLGRLLFFDGRLSGDGSTSCAACHSPDSAWTDGLPLSAGYSRGTFTSATPPR